MSEHTARGRVVVAGGSGFLGLSLATHLTSKGWSVMVLSRNPRRRQGPWRHIRWDSRNLGEWSRALNGACGLVNLVGRSVDCVKTPEHQDEILRSRVEATRALGLAVRSVEAPPPVWVQMSTAHLWRSAGCYLYRGFSFRLWPCAVWWGERGKVNSNRWWCLRSEVSSRHELCHRSRPRSRRRCAGPLAHSGSIGAGRDGRFGHAGDELDSRSRHESALRTRVNR